MGKGGRGDNGKGGRGHDGKGRQRELWEGWERG